MKILITGVAGTGKSTISKALNNRGITSVDFSDISDLCYWRDKITGAKAEYSPIHDVEWLDSHERICDLEKLKELLGQYKDIVITGIANGNQTEYFYLFDKIMLLECRPETIIHRMQSRETLWGKTNVERDYTLKWQKEFDAQCISKGAIPINTEGNLDIVVDKIINQIRMVR
jgi:broad-specificity NMP kinase